MHVIKILICLFTSQIRKMLYMPKIVNEKDKAETNTLSLPKSLWGRVKEAVDRDFGGNRSDYFRSIVERDLEARDAAVPVEESGPFLEQLALRLCGEQAATAIHQQSINTEQGKPERIIMRELIEAYVNMIQSGGDIMHSSYNDRPSLVNGSNFINFIKQYAHIYARQLEVRLLELRNSFPGMLTDNEIQALAREVILAYAVHNAVNPSCMLQPSQSITSAIPTRGNDATGDLSNPDLERDHRKSSFTQTAPAIQPRQTPAARSSSSSSA